MTGLTLRLAGPLQSWGEHSRFTDRDTLTHPTRSGIIGLIAAARGLPRDHPLDWAESLRFTIRIDRPGQYLNDFHTAGGGLPRHRSIPTASGIRRREGTATMVTRREYLADAVFTVAVEGPGDLTGTIAAALQAPYWQPYLGRRSCPPDPPLYLRRTSDPVRDLTEHIPLPRDPTHQPADGMVIVDLITEPEAAPPGAQLTEIADQPVSFTSNDRRHRARNVARFTVAVPVALAAWPTTSAYQHALASYARSTP